MSSAANGERYNALYLNLWYLYLNLLQHQVGSKIYAAAEGLQRQIMIGTLGGMLTEWQ